MLARIYAGLGAAMILGYIAITQAGWEFTSPKRQFVPSSVRQSPGGYRSYHLWHTGFRGGK